VECGHGKEWLYQRIGHGVAICGVHSILIAFSEQIMMYHGSGRVEVLVGHSMEVFLMCGDFWVQCAAFVLSRGEFWVCHVLAAQLLCVLLMRLCVSARVARHGMLCDIMFISHTTPLTSQ
jgi:hypothetical protein